MLISVSLGRGRSSSHHAETGEDEADAQNGQGGWLGDWRSEEAVHVVVKTSNDLSRVVDAEGHRSGSARHVDLGEAAAGVEEAVVACACEK